ncbi:MAG: DUF2461 domain-containing protein [Gemmobacter sp.]
MTTEQTGGFAAMIATTRAFMAELAQNNDRDWFEGRKALFKSEIEAPVKLLIDLVAGDLSRLTGTSHSGKMGRIYRDTRFSKDKSPYNTHIHAYWQQSGGAGPGWLLHIDATGASFMTGLHALEPDGLERYRAAVDHDGSALAEAMDTARAAGAEMIDFGQPALKKVPKPYAPDHRDADLLRRKQIALGMRLDGVGPSDELVPAIARCAEGLLPFWRWCDRAVG